MLSRNLLSLLVSLLLTLSPFASFNVVAATAADGSGHCTKMDRSSADGIGDIQNIRTADSHQAMSGCRHCKDDSCNNNDCGNHGCSAGQGLSLILAPGLAGLDHSAIRHTASLSVGLLSRIAPPPLPPPA